MEKNTSGTKAAVNRSHFIKMTLKLNKHSFTHYIYIYMFVDFWK